MDPAPTERTGLNAVEQTAVALRRAAQAGNHRRCLVLAGERSWCRQAARAVLSAVELEPCLWIGEDAPEDLWSLPAGRALSVLGRELEGLVFDAWSGFHLDAFGAISGALRGGGLLMLLAPPLATWPEYADPEYARLRVPPFGPEAVRGRFLRHLVQVLGEAEGVTIVDPHGAAVQAQAQGRPQPPPAAESADPDCRTRDQAQAVAAVMRVATGHRRRPVVLTADRGRGKSAALGIAAARLLGQGITPIVVTGPRLEAVEAVFQHAHRLLPRARTTRASLHAGEGRLEYLPPDALVHESHPARLLLVDEAAAIPAPLLERLLVRYPRIAFATTVHGYEGTGRGFAVRFNRVLDRRTPRWKALCLETPIRWAAGDPLERFVFRALLLDAAAAPEAALAPARPGNCLIERVDRDALVRNGALLSELFGLLVLAHYRTRPYDLRYLLDGPNVSVYVMRYEGHVAACALVAAEGGLDAAMARGIWAGRTRPQGHLIPESLAAHVGLEQAPRLRCARIMRIAVHPRVQSRGLGTRLLRSISEQAAAAGFDYVGSSFGATVELLRFWDRAGFSPVRLSVTRGAASGAHSVMVLRSASAPGQALVVQARERFHQLLPHQLADPLRRLEPDLAAFCLRRNHAPVAAELDARDWSDCIAFAWGGRIYEVCMAPLWKLAHAALSDPAATLLEPMETRVLVLKILQRQSWTEAARALEVPGRAGVTALLRRAVGKLVMHYGDRGVREQAQALMRETIERGPESG